MKDHLSFGVNKGLVPFARFGVTVRNQRAVVFLLAQIRSNRRIVRRAVSIWSANLIPTLFLCNRADSQSYKPGCYGRCYFRFNR